MMSRGDIEHYESLLVIEIAKALAPKNTEWDGLSYSKKQDFLDSAVDVVSALQRNPECLKRFAKMHERVKEKEQEQAPGRKFG